MTAKKKSLGRGLEAYFDLQDEPVAAGGSISLLDINDVEPNPGQPRKDFEQSALIELSESIKEHGIIQPIIVAEENGFYRIIAGERRYRAARIAKLDKIPAIIKNVDEIKSLEIALVENLQRKDLNIMEEALCYKRLMDEFSMTQDEVADKVSKSRSNIANCLRLLNLDKRVQSFIRENKISMGHGRAILGLSDKDKQFETAEKIIEDDLSVRAVEDLIKKLNEPTNEDSKSDKSSREKSEFPHIKSLQDDLAAKFGTKVNIVSGKRKGKIEIEYYGGEDLDRLLLLLGK